MTEWEPERVVTVAKAAAMIAERFPIMREVPVRPFASGWDNTLFLAADKWIFRFPVRAIAVPGVEREIAFLPDLASALLAGSLAGLRRADPG